jgi:malate dehydrogenase (oxaloacetate-decarboxylating)(NADP+)
MFLIAAQTLATLVSDEDLALGRVYPPLTKIRDVSAKIGAAVVKEAHRLGLAQLPLADDVEADVRSRMFVPEYRDLV